MSKLPRDNQKKRLYDAERQHSLWEDNACGRMSVADMQAFVDKVTRSAWFVRRFGRRFGILVKDGRGHQNATGNGQNRTLQMPRWSRSKLVLLHEIAHVVTEYKRGPWTEGGPHGKTFCAWYLTLIRYVLGKDAYAEMRQCFRAGRVKVAPLPKPQYTSKGRMKA